LKPSRQGGELVPDVFDNRLIPILTRLDTVVGELLSDVSLAYVLAPPEVDDGYLTAVCGSQALSASASLHVDVPADFLAAGKVVAPTALVDGPHAKIKALFEEFDLGSEVAALSLVGAASLSELLACEQQLRLRLQRLPDKAGRIQFIQWYLKVCFEVDVSGEGIDDIEEEEILYYRGSEPVNDDEEDDCYEEEILYYRGSELVNDDEEDDCYEEDYVEHAWPSSLHDLHGQRSDDDANVLAESSILGLDSGVSDADALQSRFWFLLPEEWVVLRAVSRYHKQLAENVVDLLDSRSGHVADDNPLEQLHEWIGADYDCDT
jgi:hypothetical protein